MARPLIEPMTLALPHRGKTGRARWAGLRVLHLTDLHVRGPRPRHGRLLDELAACDADLVLLTGDYMTKAGDERAALPVLRRVVEALRPRLGLYGVFGNHDTPAFAEACRARLPRVRWLGNEAVGAAAGDGRRSGLLAEAGLRLSGLHSLSTTQPDPVALLASRAAAWGAGWRRGGVPSRDWCRRRSHRTRAAGDQWTEHRAGPRAGG